MGTPPTESHDYARPLLKVRNLTKTFPGTKALAGVDLTLEAGRITALVGHNGSGKSTLVKILAGVYTPDEDGSLTDGTGEQGWQARTHFIHQDLGLVDALSTVENLDLGRPVGLRGIGPSPVRREAGVAKDLIRTFGVDFDVHAPVGTLTPTFRSIVAISRALQSWSDPAQVLVLDEPTASLQDKEAETLMAVVQRIANRGAAVLYISHRLAEIERLADHVVVLQNGTVVAQADRGNFDAHSLVEIIAGHAVEEKQGAARAEHGVERLVITGLEGARVRGIDLRVRSGEIVGVSGVLGSGIEDLLGCLFGASGDTRGTVSVDGEQVDLSRPHKAIAAGFGFVPGDRHRHGAILSLSARENLTLPLLRPFRRARGSVDLHKERAEVWTWFQRSAVRPATPERALAQFSGGNQQKIVLSKWLRNEPRVLMLEEPTQGVDAGAQDAIYSMIDGAAALGAAVLIASSDTKELVRICDRVVVMSEGRITAELSGAQLTEGRLVRLTLASQLASTEPDTEKDSA